MKYQEVMKQLESMGTAQNRKIYKRHGMKEPLFGVSYANLGKLKRAIKTDHDLAMKLWASGNADARALARMVADPALMKSSDLDAWLRDCEDHGLTGHVAGIASESRFEKTKMEKWMRSKQEFPGQAGYDMLATYAMKDNGEPDEYFEGHLEVIEEQIGEARNRVRHAMNLALIAIALRNSKLEKKALALARRLGKIDVDHGETGCKTPYAPDYVKNAKLQRKKQAERRKAAQAKKSVA